MIVQSIPTILKQRNQVNRECLYAWYPEVVSETNLNNDPRDIYIHKGIDKDLIQNISSTNRFINTTDDDCNNSNNNNNDDLLHRYQQSIAPSERIYQSTETLDEALKTPWALHYEVERRAATPNFPSNSIDISTTRENLPRRLKSAPLVRSLPATTILTIPEPKFVTPIISVPTNQLVQTPSTTKSRARASSAKARLNTTFPLTNEPLNPELNANKRNIKSAQPTRPKDEINASIEQNQKSTIQVYNDVIQQKHEQPPPSPFAYSKSTTPVQRRQLRSAIEISTVPLNQFYVHRPGVISVRNTEKKAVIPDSYSTTKKPSKHHRRHHHHHHHYREKQTQPLLALTPISQAPKLPFELDGITLIYDPTLAIDDPSLNLTRYLIEGNLYLIKDQRYNVIENVDPTSIEKYNQTLTFPQRPKYYQTIPIEKFQIPKPAPEIHYNASETYFYNTIPKQMHRYVIDPNFISEHLNVNKISLSKRPLSGASINDVRQRKPSSPMLHA